LVHSTDAAETGICLNLDETGVRQPARCINDAHALRLQGATQLPLPDTHMIQNMRVRAAQPITTHDANRQATPQRIVIANESLAHDTTEARAEKLAPTTNRQI